MGLRHLLFREEGRPQPARYFTRTRDGVRLALYRYRPEEPAPSSCPLFLCHGLGSNRFDLDYPGRSLARHLHASGFDVWLVELRGAGRSGRPPFWSRFGSWVFDDYLQHDIPAALRFIRERTGQEEIHWIGHSMGGMLAYPFLLQCDAGRVRSCVTVGAPSLVRMGEAAPAFLEPLRHLVRFLPYIPYRDLLRLLSPLLPVLEGHLGTRFYNPENLEREVVLDLIRIALHNLPTPLLLQALDWYTDRECRDYYGTFSFTGNLERIETPLLVIGGAMDRLTPPEDLKVVYDRVSSKRKRFVVMGRARGDRVDYGHVDLILGIHAPEEVFPLIRDWLVEQDLAARSGAG